jgi:hypothetical protein
LPNLERTIRTGRDETTVLVVVKAEVKDSVLVTLKLIFFILGFHVKDLDGRVLVSDDDEFVAFIKYGTVRARETRVELIGFLNHSNVPHFVDAIAVSRDNHVAAKIEFDSVNRIIMAIEGLNA